VRLNIPLPSIIITSTTDPSGELASSLSGDLSDYLLADSTPGNIIAPHSYKQCFRSAKMELQIVIEKEKLEEEQRILVRTQVYKNILNGKPRPSRSLWSLQLVKNHLTELHAVWWLHLDPHTRYVLHREFKTILHLEVDCMSLHCPSKVGGLTFSPSARYFCKVVDTVA